jgi:hypothetical protein
MAVPGALLFRSMEKESMRHLHPSARTALVSLTLAATLLSGCSASPQAQAQPGTINDILPTPPPMPTAAAVAPTATPPAAPAAPEVAGAQRLLTPRVTAETGLNGWQVFDAADVRGEPSIWGVRDGRLAQISDGSGRPGTYGTTLVTGDPSWSDYQVNAEAYATSNDEMGVTARASENGFYAFRLLPAASGQPTRLLARYDTTDEQFHTLATAEGPGFANDTWYTLGLRVQGDHLTALVNGKAVLEAHDATLAQGQAGVYGYAEGGLVFDHIAVDSLTK